MGRQQRGKKAWRKVDDSQVAEFIEEAGYQERRGPAVETLKDSDLFFVDKTADVEEVEAKLLGRKRKREAKPLRSQLILDASFKAKPVAPAPRRKDVNPLPARRTGGPAAQQQRAPAAAGARQAPELDLWADEGDEAGAGGASQDEGWLSSKPAVLLTSKKQNNAKRPAKRLCWAPPPVIPAVPVDLPGCSFHPEPEQHQEALAALVAAEMKKVLAKELAPKAPVLHAFDGSVNGGYQDELTRLVTYEELGEEEEKERGGGGGKAAMAVDENEIDVDGDDDDEEEGWVGGRRSGQAGRKKTAKDRNRQARRREAEAELAASRALKAQRRQIDAVKALEAQLAEEEAEREARRLRRATVGAEKATIMPPKLSRHRFEPAPVQVLTSDELTGSLRTVSPCPMVLSDRYKSLQARGLVEVRRPRGAAFSQRSSRNKKLWEKGAQRERAEAGQAEVKALQRQNAEKKKALATASGK